jgi:hypothetical protein
MLKQHQTDCGGSEIDRISGPQARRPVLAVRCWGRPSRTDRGLTEWSRLLMMWDRASPTYGVANVSRETNTPAEERKTEVRAVRIGDSTARTPAASLRQPIYRDAEQGIRLGSDRPSSAQRVEQSSRPQRPGADRGRGDRRDSPTPAQQRGAASGLKEARLTPAPGLRAVAGPARAGYSLDAPNARVSRETSPPKGGEDRQLWLVTTGVNIGCCVLPRAPNTGSVRPGG